MYVDGKLEGLRGQVTDVNYSFKIKISDYKRVIAVVDTEVHGKLWIAERGVDYYRRHKVQYLCLDGGKGYAIVQGREAYEVEFSYTQGQIRDLTCTCFCSYHCKHEFAVMLQLREILRWADRQAEQYGMKHSGYFAAIEQQTLFQIAINGRTNGCLTL